jgi:hypothetical protein
MKRYYPASDAMRADRLLTPFLLFFLSLPLPAQSAEPVSLVGITLNELVSRFGAPRTVHSVRGIEEWQDDVVFIYDHGDYYVYRDRVWQLGLKSAMGVKAGDSRAAVSRVLGSRAESRLDSIFCSLEGGSWPMTLRCDFDKDGRLLVIFIYRADL